MFAKYATAVQFDGIPLVTRDAMDYKANPTLADGDVTISKDGGASANLGTLPVVSPAGGTGVRVNLSAGDVTGKITTITFIDQTPAKEWEDQKLEIYTYGHANAFIAGDLSDIAKETSLHNLSAAAGSGIAGVDSHVAAVSAGVGATHADISFMLGTTMPVLSAAMSKDATVAKAVELAALAAKASVWDGVVASGADNRTFKVTTFPLGADWTKAAVKITSVAGGKAEVRRIYSMSAVSGLVTIEPDLGFNVAAGDTINVYDPMLLKTDFLMDGNAIHSTAGGAAYAVDSAGAALPTAAAVAGVQTVVDALQVYQKGVQLDNFSFEMVLSSDHATAATGKTVTATIKKDGGVFAAATGVIAENGTTGVYTMDRYSAAEMNAKAIVLRFTAPGCDPLVIFIKTQE